MISADEINVKSITVTFNVWYYIDLFTPYSIAYNLGDNFVLKCLININPHWETGCYRVLFIITVMDIYTAQWPEASETASQASEFGKKFLLNHIYICVENVKFWKSGR